MPKEETVEVRKLFGTLSTYNLYPNHQIGPELSTGAVAWTMGAYTEVIPSNTITTTYYIVSASVYWASPQTQYEIDLSSGLVGSEVVISNIPIHEGLNSTLHDFIFPVPLKFPGNTRLSARVAQDDPGVDTLNIKLRYRTI